jgi:hypothetical protein
LDLRGNAGQLAEVALSDLSLLLAWNLLRLRSVLGEGELDFNG